MTYRKYYSTRQTPQAMPMPGAGQVPNAAGGYAWAVDDWAQMDRFLVLGSEGGTYYIGERKLTVENAQAVHRCIQVDGVRTVRRIVEISAAGRAPKNDPALFALAMAAGVGDAATRQAAMLALPHIARTGTHLFHFLAYVEGFRGWGRALRRAVAGWYTAMPAEKLAYQAVKYQQRDGWGHRDALRLAHPKAPTAQHDAIFYWMVKGWAEVGDEAHPEPALRQIWALERARRVADVHEMVGLIERYDLPWEAVPTPWLGEAPVWQALLPKLPMTAMLRNLARMTANGTLQPMGAEMRYVVERLGDKQAIAKARIHPIAVLAALKTYAQGHGERGSLQWQPLAPITDALDAAFYLAFGNVEATGKRIVLALDVSGSMDGGVIAGVPGLTPRVAAAAMSLVTAAVEPHHTIVAFAAQAGGGYGGQFGPGDPAMPPVDISPRMRLDQVVAKMQAIPMGGTDCSLPMRWALEKQVKADAFVVYTDSETWAGPVHPAQALRTYREKMGIQAKLVVVGMTANGFSIADPQDTGMLDVVGFDAATPQVISDFIAG